MRLEPQRGGYVMTIDTTRDLTTRELESHGLESHGLESHGLESHGLESHELESIAGGVSSCFGIAFCSWYAPLQTIAGGQNLLDGVGNLAGALQPSPCQSGSGCT
jgi:hypothetical protein